MSYVVIIFVALSVSILTFFSGFGLGTLLMPAFALFFPIDVAIAATAIVHLANNLFKLALTGKNAHFKTVLLFGIPAILFAFAGAWLLTLISGLEPLYTYHLGTKSCSVEPVKLFMAVLLVFFAIFELSKKLRNLTFQRKYLPVGGALSGFFGGLSGQQGALRAAFLVKSGLPKEQFVGTGVMVSVFVDISRLIVYGYYFTNTSLLTNNPTVVNLIILGTLAAFIGSFFGNRLIKKVTLATIQKFVGFMLLIVALLLAFGVI